MKRRETDPASNQFPKCSPPSCQSRFDARHWMLGASALGLPRGMVWGGRRVQDGEHMYTCGGFILIFGKTNTIM